MGTKAIVIFYTGERIDQSGAEMLIGSLAKYLSEGESHPTIKIFDENDLSREILKVVTPPRQSTEDGDDAVRVIMPMLPVTILNNPMALAIHLTKLLTTAQTHNTEKDRAFMRAMSILYQGNPVSKKVKEDWNFTSTIRNAVKEVYRTYITA